MKIAESGLERRIQEVMLIKCNLILCLGKE